MTTQKSSDQIDLAEFLNQQHLCETLTINEVKTLMEFTKPVFVKKNEIIADIGDVGEALYFIISGEVALFFDDHGKDVEIGRLKEGEIMGEMSFFDRQALAQVSDHAIKTSQYAFGDPCNDCVSYCGYRNHQHVHHAHQRTGPQYFSVKHRRVESENIQFIS